MTYSMTKKVTMLNNKVQNHATVLKQGNFPLWEIIKRIIIPVRVFSQTALELISEPDTLSILCSFHAVSSHRFKFIQIFLFLFPRL